MPVRPLEVDAAERGIVAGDRSVLARAISLIESRRADDRRKAEELVRRIGPRTGKALRLGISGVPGAGKSTLIEALGTRLLDRGKRVAVLAIDPSSTVSGGSILGDKTRMPRLSGDLRAFVRPSPAGDRLGGVAERTREALLLCEAFGFDVVIVETVGVGQAEAEVASMVDGFLLVLLAGAGDDLQGMKRGVIELCDFVAVNKADGDNVAASELAAREIASSLAFLRPRSSAWAARAMTVSAKTGAGLDALWTAIVEHRAALEASGELVERRRSQAREWMWSLVDAGLRSSLRDHPRLREHIAGLESDVASGSKLPEQAAREIVDRLLGG